MEHLVHMHASVRAYMCVPPAGTRLAYLFPFLGQIWRATSSSLLLLTSCTRCAGSFPATRDRLSLSSFHPQSFILGYLCVCGPETLCQHGSTPAPPSGAMSSHTMPPIIVLAPSWWFAAEVFC